MAPDREAVLAAYTDGVAAVGRCAAAVTDWAGPTPCADWRAVDLAGHLLAIVRYFRGLLDAAQAGAPRTGLPVGSALQAMNAREVAALPDAVVPDMAGPERIAHFVQLARDHAARLAAADWGAALGRWDGVGWLTVEEHSGLAAGEWHVHAWDLARAAGTQHCPADPETVAAGRVALFGPPRDGDAWASVLMSAGRTP